MNKTVVSMDNGEKTISVPTQNNVAKTEERSGPFPPSNQKIFLVSVKKKLG
jgi:hypothetical protein